MLCTQPLRPFPSTCHPILLHILRLPDWRRAALVTPNQPHFPFSHAIQDSNQPSAPAPTISSFRLHPRLHPAYMLSMRCTTYAFPANPCVNQQHGEMALAWQVCRRPEITVCGDEPFRIESHSGISQGTTAQQRCTRRAAEHEEQSAKAAQAGKGTNWVRGMGLEAAAQLASAAVLSLLRSGPCACAPCTASQA